MPTYFNDQVIGRAVERSGLSVYEVIAARVHLAGTRVLVVFEQLIHRRLAEDGG
jgi:hypothetical protein